MFGIDIRERRAGVAGQLDYNRPKANRKFPDEVIEQALWEVAVHGGSCTRAYKALKERGITGPDGEEVRRSTIDYWKRQSHRNRYHEILQLKAGELDERLAQQAQANAIQMGDVAEKALRQTEAGIAGASGVEASQILRNVAQARASEIDKAQVLRGKDPGTRAARSLEEIAKDLGRLGVVEVERENAEGVIEAEVVEGSEVLLDGGDEAGGEPGDDVPVERPAGDVAAVDR